MGTAGSSVSNNTLSGNTSNANNSDNKGSTTSVAGLNPVTTATTSNTSASAAAAAAAAAASNFQMPAGLVSPNTNTTSISQNLNLNHLTGQVSNTSGTTVTTP